MPAFNFFPALALAATYKYVPMETIPGFGNPTDFPSYVSAVYKFGLLDYRRLCYAYDRTWWIYVSCFGRKMLHKPEFPKE